MCEVSAVIASQTFEILQVTELTSHNSFRFDNTGSDALVTGGSVDGNVKVWNTSNGTLRATLKGGSSNAIIAVDITNHLVAGGGSDKTCRIWNYNTNRMVHHLVGHANKITSVRFFGGERGIVTAAADRQIKVWDISKQTYRQTATINVNSTVNSVDVGFDSYTLSSGHTDGGLRFWDMRNGERSAEFKRTKFLSNFAKFAFVMTTTNLSLGEFPIASFPPCSLDVHESTLTSVQFHPIDSTRVLTNGMDSCLKIVDLRIGKPTHVFRHPDFHTSYNWSTSSFSPDGKKIESTHSLQRSNLFLMRVFLCQVPT